MAGLDPVTELYVETARTETVLPARPVRAFLLQAVQEYNRVEAQAKIAVRDAMDRLQAAIQTAEWTEGLDPEDYAFDEEGITFIYKHGQEESEE